MMITTQDMDRVGVTRHAEAFETLAACRARFQELKAELSTGLEDAGVCVVTLRPAAGLPHWTVAVLMAASPSSEPRPLHLQRIVARGRPVELPDEVLAATHGEEQVHICHTMNDRRALCGLQPPAGYTWSLWPYDQQGEDEVWDHHVWAGDMDPEDVPEGGLICGICRDLYEALTQAQEIGREVDETTGRS